MTNDACLASSVLHLVVLLLVCNSIAHYLADLGVSLMPGDIQLWPDMLPVLVVDNLLSA
uniref:Uncharacterized protein n=1 Tax=Setaria viridis TaxID=4556 RepID=A0A4U6VB48_SETVI|nr:hypothetical protein SEVIR_3G088550v2 [Setaria viridis]